MLTYDSAGLGERLDRMTAWQRTVFAAACAERMLPAYRRFSELEATGDPDLLEAAADELWRALAGSPPSDGRIRHIIDSCTELVPTEDDYNEWANRAEDAVAAVVYAWQSFQSGERDPAMWCAQRGWAYAEDLAGAIIPDDMSGPEGIRAIEESGFVQAELASQARDLDDIAALAEPEAADLDFLRRRGPAS